MDLDKQEDEYYLLMIICCFWFDFSELHSRQPVPFLPGDSINDSLLMNDLDENTQLRNAVAKLTRRVQDLEDNDKTRSYILYPTVLVLSLKLLYDVFIKSKWLYGRKRQ